MPSMEARVELPLDLERARGIVLDPMYIGRAAPDVEKVEKVSEENYVWTVVVKIGVLKKVVRLDTVIKKREEGLDFSGTSDEVDIKGRVSLLPADGQRCTLLFRAEYTGKGRMGAIVNNVIRGRTQSATADFQRRVLELLTQRS